MSRIETLASHPTGRLRRQAGTDWPVEVALQRVGVARYQVVVLCNGLALSSRRYSTRWAAWDAYEREEAPDAR